MLYKSENTSSHTITVVHVVTTAIFVAVIDAAVGCFYFFQHYTKQTTQYLFYFLTSYVNTMVTNITLLVMQTIDAFVSPTLIFTFFISIKASCSTSVLYFFHWVIISSQKSVIFHETWDFYKYRISNYSIDNGSGFDICLILGCFPWRLTLL